MGSEDAKSFSSYNLLPPFYFFKFLWGDDLTFFLFLFSVFTLLFAPAMMFFSPSSRRRGWLSFFKNLSLSFGLTGPSISEPQPMVKNGIKIELAKEKKSFDERKKTPEK